MRPFKLLFFASLSFVLILPCPGLANRVHPEKWYQERWCNDHGGQMEVVLADQTRCDCETEIHAVEFDFADKWAEAIGQALHYSRLTGKRAGIVLLLESDKNRKFKNRLENTMKYFNLPVDVWLVTY